jgi:hypothetical protein
MLGIDLDDAPQILLGGAIRSSFTAASARA